MSFVVGDIIRGKANYNYCSITNRRSLLLVKEVIDGGMNVIVLYHDDYSNQIGRSFLVNNSSTEYEYSTFEDFEMDFPYCYKMGTDELNSLLLQYTKEGAKEIEPYVLSDEMRKELLEEMKDLLVEFHYHPTDEGLNEILDEWCKNKADLIRMFEKHPNYNGKFQIVFDYDYDRKIDEDAIYSFRGWMKSKEVKDTIVKEIKLGVYSYTELRRICDKLYSLYIEFERNAHIKTINGKTQKEYADEYMHFKKFKDRYVYDENIYCEDSHAYERKSYECFERIYRVDDILYSSSTLYQHVNDRAKDYFTSYFPEAKIKKGQKMSRAINKVLCMLGVDKSPNYNKEFAKFADAINPLKIKRHTVISIHPVDYYTMSFGNSWSSCHTIDKDNDRGIDSSHSYRGCSSSGTESYMLDGTSCIFYTVRSEYNGNSLELEDKINRCMFHYYDNRLLQGRVYPQSNDSGANSLYKDIREIVQKIFADMLEVPNYWTNKSGTSACYDATSSYGTHYRDYYNFDNCNVSTLKDDRTAHKRIPIGHYPICPCCGEEHSRERNIECDDCNY